MDKNKKEKKDKRDEDINKANKEMEDLIKSIKDQVGADVKVVKVNVPKPTPKNFIIGVLTGFLVNSLLIIGTCGYFDFLIYKTIFHLLLFCLYFTLIEKVSSFIMLQCFPTFVVKTFGFANFIPVGITLIVSLIFPIFVQIENVGLAFIIFIIILALRMFLKSFFLEKEIKKRMRGLKK